MDIQFSPSISTKNVVFLRNERWSVIGSLAASGTNQIEAQHLVPSYNYFKGLCRGMISQYLGL